MLICKKCTCRVNNMYPGKYFCPIHGIIWEHDVKEVAELIKEHTDDREKI
jgi:uncharacterized Zn finger protein (UPF0148 family)